MVGITEISAGMASLNAAKTILGAMVGMRDATKLNEMRIELQGAILTAQQGLFAAQQDHAASTSREDELKQQIMRLKDWSSERERYELLGIDGNVFVYMQKAGMRSAEPAHWLCPRCFEDRKKSILQAQPRATAERTKTWACPTCKTSLATHWSQKPEYVEAADGFQSAAPANL